MLGGDCRSSVESLCQLAAGSLWFYTMRFGFMRVLSCELFMGHDSYCLAWCYWFHMNRRSMLSSRYWLVFIWLHRSMFLSLCRSTPMWTSETHRALNFKISFLEILLLKYLPEIILYDGIHVVLHCFISFTLEEGLLLLKNISCLNHLCLQLLHMCTQSLKLCIQLSVDNIYLPIDIYHQLLLALKNLINHWSCCCRVYGTVNSGWSYLSVHKSLCIHSGFQVSDSKNQYHWWSSDPPRNLCHCWHLQLEFSSAKLTCFLRSLWTLSSLALTSSSSSFPRVANFLLSKSCSWYYYWMPSSQ